MRDSQRQRVYDAQYGKFWPYSFVKRHSLEECQAFVDSVTRSAWWKRRSPRSHVPVTVGARGGRAWAMYDGRIRTSPDSRNYRVMLHELAHILTDSHSRGCAAHGPEFCANYVALARQFAGKEVGDGLKASFRQHRVRVRGAAQPKRSIRQRCFGCDKVFTAGTGWVSNQTGAKFHSKRCGVEWFSADLKKVA